MNALSAGIHQYRDREFQLADDLVLLFDLQLIRLHKRITVLSNVGIPDAITVQRVEPDPGARLRIVIAKRCPDIVPMFGNLFEDLPCRQVVDALTDWDIFLPLFVEAGLHIDADHFTRFEQRLDIARCLFARMPFRRLPDLASFHPSGRNDYAFLVFDFIVPGQLTSFVRGIAEFRSQLVNGSAGHDLTRGFLE